MNRTRRQRAVERNLGRDAAPRSVHAPTYSEGTSVADRVLQSRQEDAAIRAQHGPVRVLFKDGKQMFPESFRAIEEGIAEALKP